MFCRTVAPNAMYHSMTSQSVRHRGLRSALFARPSPGLSHLSSWLTWNKGPPAQPSRPSLSRPARCLSTSVASATLYQYAICPYCNIAKALLHYTGTPYKAVEVNPLTKAELKPLLDQDYKKVPIFTKLDDGTQINGSEEIVRDILEANHTIDSSSDSAAMWTAFARDDLAPLLYPNLCNSLSSSYQAFGYVHSTPSFSMAQRYSIQFVGSMAMYFAATKIKQKRNITDERAELKAALDNLEAALDETSFLSNTDQPHLGDLTIYGVLTALRGLAVMKVLEDYPKITAWLSKMHQVVEQETYRHRTQGSLPTSQWIKP